MLLETTQEWLVETPMGEFGVMSPHTHYSYMVFGGVVSESSMSFEAAKDAYPFALFSIFFVLLCAVIGFGSLLRKTIHLFRKSTKTVSA